MQEQDTVQPSTETVPAQDHSNNAEVPAQGAGTDSKADELAAQLEAERKARQQAEMRAKQLENERQERERKIQEEQGQYKELYEAERARLAELEEQRKMDELMAGYDPEIQKVAKKLFSAGDLPSQMEALQEAIKQNNASQTAEPEPPQPKVEAMNPNPRAVEQHQTMFTSEDTLEAMAEKLEKKLKGAGL